MKYWSPNKYNKNGAHPSAIPNIYLLILIPFPLFILIFHLMFSLFRSQASALHSISRCFSSAPRRLMKKGVVSPINPVPAGIMRPYDSFDGQSVLANQFSILNDYV